MKKIVFFLIGVIALSATSCVFAGQPPKTLSDSVVNPYSPPITAYEQEQLDKLKVKGPKGPLLLWYANASKKERRAFLSKCRHPLVSSTATSIMGPVAYAEYGQAYIGLGAVNQWPNGGGEADGFLMLGGVVGDPDRWLSLETTVLIDDLGLRQHAFGSNGTVAFKIARWLGRNTAIAAGVGNAIPWGDAFKDKNHSYYIVATQIMPLRPYCNNPMPLTVSLGYGTGSFLSPNAFLETNNFNGAPFVSLGLNVLPRLALIGDWNHKVLSTGISVSLQPFKILPPLIITAYATNIAGSGREPGPVTYGINVVTGFQFY